MAFGFALAVRPSFPPTFKSVSLHERTTMKTCIAIFALLLALAAPARAHLGDARIVAPIVNGIAIDGDLSDWPAQMEQYPILNHGQAYGPTDIDDADLSASDDLTPQFKIGYDPEEQLIFLAITVRDDVHDVQDYNRVFRDGVEIYVDGDHSGGVPNIGNSLATATGPQLLQYVGIAADQKHYSDPGHNYNLRLADIRQTRTRMAYDRRGDITTYEWVIQAFDHYPEHPTQLFPGKTIGFDVVVVDNDGDGGNTAWVCWGAPYAPYKNGNADLLGDVVLGYSEAEGTAKRGLIAGAATDAAEKTPVANLALVAYRGDQPAGMTYTDPDGRYGLYLLPGDYTLKLQPGQGYKMASADLTVEIGAEVRADLAPTPILLPAALEKSAALYAALQTYKDSSAVEIDAGLETTTAAFAWKASDQVRLESVDWASGNLTAIYHNAPQTTRYESQFQQYVQEDAEENFRFDHLSYTMPGLRVVQQLVLSDDPLVLLRRGLDAVRLVGRENLDGHAIDLVDLTLIATDGALLAAGRDFDPVRLRLWLDAKTYAIRQASYALQGASYTEYYDYIELDPALDADHFRFAAPEGAELAFRMGEGKSGKELIGQPAPNFSLVDYEGKPVRLADFAGRVVLVDFWGTWCPPCRMAMPNLVELHREYTAKGFDIVAISVPPDDADMVRQYAADNGIAFPLPLAAGSVQQDYGINSYPTSLFVDKQGVVRYTHGGFSDDMKASYSNHIKQLLAE